MFIQEIQETGGTFEEKINDIREGQEINVEDEIINITDGETNVQCLKVNDTTLENSEWETVRKESGTEWYIPKSALSTSKDDVLTWGLGGKVAIETNPGAAGSALADFSNQTTLDNYKSNGVTGATLLRDKSNIIVGTVQVIGTVIAVIVLTVMGIRYMVSGIEERAEFKETMIPYMIGAGALLIISNVVGLIYSVITNI